MCAASDQEPKFKTANEFSLYIERFVLNSKNINHVDAVLKYCQENQIDEEDIKHLINKSLLNKLRNDFIEMNYIQKTTNSINL